MLFRLLRSAPADKRHFLMEGGHAVPRKLLVKESLDWLDRYRAGERILVSAYAHIEQREKATRRRARGVLECRFVVTVNPKGLSECPVGRLAVGGLCIP